MTESLATVEALFQEAARLATEVVRENRTGDRPVVRHLEPSALRRALELELPAEGRGVEQALELARRTLHYSVATGHPRFLNQLFGGFDATGVLGEWITALTNTSMYTYEAAPVGTVVELALLEKLAGYVGFEEGEGVFTPGGSIANLIVAEKAHQGGVELGFAAHFKFCGWTTLLIAAGGCCIIFFLGRGLLVAERRLGGVPEPIFGAIHGGTLVF